MSLHRHLAILLLMSACVKGADPIDCASLPTFEAWLRCRINNVRNAGQKNQLKENLKQIATEKQASQPSSASSSTSLLDRSSATDLISSAVQLAGFGNAPNTGASTGDFSATASAYALYVTMSGLKQLDPEVYDKGINYRRLSFTLGTETPTDELSKNNGRNRIFGGKFLLLNNRDVSTAQNKERLNNLSFGTVGGDRARLTVRVRMFIVELFPPDTPNLFQDATWPNTVQQLKDADLAQIDSLIQESGLVESLNSLSANVKKLVRQIRTAPQLSISYTGKLAEKRDLGIDTHRAEAVFDYGFAEWIGVTINGSFDYLNRRMIGGDVRSARLAGELHFAPRHDQALQRGVSPLLFGLSGESNWMNSYDSIYRVQARVEIPIAKGISLPISVTRSNRADILKKSEAEVRGQFGFTIDVAKLAGLFKVQ